MRRNESRNFGAEATAAAQAPRPERKETRRRAGCGRRSPPFHAAPLQGLRSALSVPHSTARISSNGFYSPHLFGPVLGANVRKSDFWMEGAARLEWRESLPEALSTAFSFPLPHSVRLAEKARLTFPKAFAACCWNVRRPQWLPLAHGERRGFLA